MKEKIFYAGLDTGKREVQRGRAPAEAVHGGLPHQKAEEEPGGNPAVLCGGEPRGNHPSRNMGAGAGGNGAAQEYGRKVQQREHIFLENQVFRVRELVRLQGVALAGQIPQGDLPVQPQVQER